MPDGKRKTGKQPEAKSAATPGKSESVPAGNKANEKGKAGLEQATKVMGTLAPLSASAIWKNTFKDSDITARLKKASQCASVLAQQGSTLENGHVKSEMEGMATRMEKKIKEIGITQEILGELRAKNQKVLPVLTDPDKKQKLTETLPLMDAETMAMVLLSVGQKLTEACNERPLVIIDPWG